MSKLTEQEQKVLAEIKKRMTPEGGELLDWHPELSIPEAATVLQVLAERGRVEIIKPTTDWVVNFILPAYGIAFQVRELELPLAITKTMIKLFETGHFE